MSRLDEIIVEVLNMKKTLCALVAMVMLVAFSAPALSHDHEDRYVREEAARRNIKLLTLQEAQGIAAERIHERNVRFKDAELEDEADDYPNGSDFRPVWSLECLAGGQEYEIEIDAVTGEILKFKLDD